MATAATRLFLMTTAFLTLDASAADIIVTADRPDPCELDPFCTSGTREDALALTSQPDFNPMGDPVGDGGGGNQIIVERDRGEKYEEDKEDECSTQADNAAFLGRGSTPSETVIVHGEAHDGPRADDPQERTNRSRQEDLLDSANEDAEGDDDNLCLGLEFGRGVSPNSSQEAMYRYAAARGIPTFNADATQNVGAPSAACNGVTLEWDRPGWDEGRALSCMNTRDQGMVSSIQSALTNGVNGSSCDRVMLIVGDAHTSRTISHEVTDTNPFQRTTVVDLLEEAGIDTFVDNRAMREEVCQDE